MTNKNGNSKKQIPFGNDNKNRNSKQQIPFGNDKQEKQKFTRWRRSGVGAV
jgi:hypothetical protein